MFTPPPSPLPAREPSFGQSAPAVSLEPSPSTTLKRKTASRIRWSVLAIPALLVIITLTTRYISHPFVLDYVSSYPPLPHDSSGFNDWGHHQPHPDPHPPVVHHAIRANTNPTPSVTAVPTIPDNPPLPTPFPQPFDTTLSKNFSTQTCIDFYTNMTLSLPFRRCRPFGLLAGYSSQFIEAQSNITLLNEMVWGTCNTTVDADTCTQNMDWFASSLKDQCDTELSQRNPFVANTLDALDLFALSRQAGCLSNPDTNVYCYVQAAAQPTASDVYFYQVLFGLQIPNNTKPSCSSCTKSLMNLYLSAISGPGKITDNDVQSMLARAYAYAADIASGVCGNGYVQAVEVSGSASPSSSLPLSSLWFALFIGCISVLL